MRSSLENPTPVSWRGDSNGWNGLWLVVRRCDSVSARGHGINGGGVGFGDWEEEPERSSVSVSISVSNSGWYNEMEEEEEEESRRRVVETELRRSI